MTKADEKKLSRLKGELRQLKAEIETQKRRFHHNLNLIASGEEKDILNRSWHFFILDLEESRISLEKEIVRVEGNLDPTQRILQKHASNLERGRGHK